MTQKKEGITKTAASEYYQCRFYLPDGTRIRQSTGEKEYTAAWNKYQRLRKQHGIAPDTGNEPTVGQILADYEVIKIKQGDKDLVTVYPSNKKSILKYSPPETPWRQLTDKNSPLHIQNFVDAELKRGVKASFIERKLSILSAAAEYAIIHNEMDIRNPRKLATYKKEKPSYYWLSREQARKLLDVAKNMHNSVSSHYSLHDYIFIALSTGLRPNEILSIKIEDVLFEHEHIFIPITKNDTSHNVPITEGMVEILKRRIAFANTWESEWLFVNPFYRKDKTKPLKPYTRFIGSFKHACKKAGIPVSSKKQRGMKIYSLRHTFATWLCAEGVSVERVSQLLNHADISMTMRYVRVAAKWRKEAVDKLPPL